MGVCVPEEYGGAGADFLSYILVLEELSRADAGVGVTVAVHTSAVTLPILAVRHRRAARAIRAAARARRADRRVRADRAGGRLGRRLAAHVGDARERAAGGSRGRSVDHDARGTRGRSCSSRAPTRRLATPTASPRSSSTAAHVTVTRDEEKLGLNSSTTSDIVVDAVVGRRPAAARGGQGLPGRDGDARRRPDRDRRAGGRDRAGRVRGGARVRARAAAVRQADRRAAGDPAQARRHVDGDRRRAAARPAARRG